LGVTGKKFAEADSYYEYIGSFISRHYLLDRTDGYLCCLKKGFFTDARLPENASECSNSDLLMMRDNAGLSGLLVPLYLMSTQWESITS
jgi:hypothetical protein